MTLLFRPALRVVLCRGQYCNLGRRADHLYAQLSAAVDAINEAHDGPPCIGLRTANCLSMCGKGPNMVIYPEDAVFNDLNAERLNEAIELYLKPSAVSLQPAATDEP